MMSGRLDRPGGATTGTPTANPQHGARLLLGYSEVTHELVGSDCFEVAAQGTCALGRPTGSKCVRGGCL
jgi:hypothetical protein